MIVRGLWGIVIEPSKKYSLKSDASFRISMASLDSFDDPKRTSVYIAFQGREFKLCSLIPEKIEQQVIDITCLEGEEIVFRSEGSNCIHLTGNYMSLYESDSEDEAGDSTNNRESEIKDTVSLSDEDIEESEEEGEESESIGIDKLGTGESFKMPIIYDFLDSLVEHDSNSRSNIGKTGTRAKSIDMPSTQQALKKMMINKDAANSEKFQLSNMDQDEREVIVIPSGQTSDVEDTNRDESSTVESNYQSCDEERDDEEEETEEEEETKVEEQDNEEEQEDSESESDESVDDNEVIPTNTLISKRKIAVKKEKSLENSMSSPADSTPLPNTNKKGKSNATVKNEKISSEASQTSSDETAESEPEKIDSAKKGRAVKNTKQTNNNRNQKSAIAAKKSLSKSNTQATDSSNKVSAKSTKVASKDTAKEVISKSTRNGNDKSKAKEESPVEQTSSETEIESVKRYPKRRRAPESERRMKWMAIEEAKMAGTVSVKRRKKQSPSPKTP